MEIGREEGAVGGRERLWEEEETLGIPKRLSPSHRRLEKKKNGRAPITYLVSSHRISSCIGQKYSWKEKRQHDGEKRTDLQNHSLFHAA